MILRGRRVVTGGALTAAAIHIENGVITAVRPFEEAGAPVIDEVILPGLVDTHVHINEPGRTHWEGFETATRAAAAGGVTTLIEMPLNSIPATTTVAAYRRKLEAAEGKLSVDTGFWGGVVPGNTRISKGCGAKASSASNVSSRHRVWTNSSTSRRPTCAKQCRYSPGLARRFLCMPSCRHFLLVLRARPMRTGWPRGPRKRNVRRL